MFIHSSMLSVRQQAALSYLVLHTRTGVLFLHSSFPTARSVFTNFIFIYSPEYFSTSCKCLHSTKILEKIEKCTPGHCGGRAILHVHDLRARNARPRQGGGSSTLQFLTTTRVWILLLDPLTQEGCSHAGEEESNMGITQFNIFYIAQDTPACRYKDKIKKCP
jgi:hypothetical protein